MLYYIIFIKILINLLLIIIIKWYFKSMFCNISQLIFQIAVIEQSLTYYISKFT